MWVGRIHTSSVRHPTWYRVLIALWGIWFTTALTEPAGIMACPMHSGMPHGVTSHGVTSHGVSSHGVTSHHAMSHDATSQEAMAGMDMSGADHTAMPHPAMPHAALPDSHDASAPAPHQCCTCLGQCPSISPAVVPPSVDLPYVPQPLQTAAAEYGPTERLATRIAYTLPYANGPPPRV